MSVKGFPFRAGGDSWLDFSLACDIPDPEFDDDKTVLENVTAAIYAGGDHWDRMGEIKASCMASLLFLILLSFSMIYLPAIINSVSNLIQRILTHFSIICVLIHNFPFYWPLNILHLYYIIQM